MKQYKMFLYVFFLKDGSDREDNMDSRTRHFEYGFNDDIDGDLKRVYCQLFGGTNIVCCSCVDTVVYVMAVNMPISHSQLPMSSVHKLIFQCLHYFVLPNENKCAVDITFGTTEYGSALCRAFVQVGMYVCIYVCVYVCMYVYMYVCMYVPLRTMSTAVCTCRLCRCASCHS